MAEAVKTAKTPALNKFEKFKAEKDGLAVKEELEHFAQIGWEAMDKTDLEQRLKWLGLFMLVLRNLLIENFGAQPR